MLNYSAGVFKYDFSGGTYVFDRIFENRKCISSSEDFVENDIGKIV